MNRLTLSVEQAAQRLGIGRGLAYDLARRGELPGCVRLGRRYLVSIAALERFLGGPAHAPRVPAPAPPRRLVRKPRSGLRRGIPGRARFSR